MALQVLSYRPSDFVPSGEEADEPEKVLTLETFADFKHLRLLDITFVDLDYEVDGPSWSMELHPHFAGSQLLH